MALIAGRMALVALIIGTSVAVAATGRIDLRLVLSSTIAWSFVPMLQLFTGLLLMRGASDLTAALAAYFATHGPWSLWILGTSVMLLLIAPARDATWGIAATAVVPAGATAMRLLRLCRTELHLAPKPALVRVAMHQAITLVALGLFASIAVALPARLGAP